MIDQLVFRNATVQSHHLLIWDADTIDGVRLVELEGLGRYEACPPLPYEIGVPLFFRMNRPSPIDVTTTIPDLKNG